MQDLNTSVKDLYEESFPQTDHKSHIHLGPTPLPGPLVAGFSGRWPGMVALGQVASVFQNEKKSKNHLYSTAKIKVPFSGDLPPSASQRGPASHQCLRRVF